MSLNDKLNLLELQRIHAAEQAVLEDLHAKGICGAAGQPCPICQAKQEPITFPEFLDSSMLSTWKSCPQLFNKIYMNHWKAKGDNVHRHAGKAFATGIEVARRCFYEGQAEIGYKSKMAADGEVPDSQVHVYECRVGDADTAVAFGIDALMKAYGDFECPPDSAKSLERMAGALEYYFDNYPLHLEGTDGVPIKLASGKYAIEFGFAHPVDVRHPQTGNPLIICGRLDAILNYAGSILVTDEKTTSSLGPTWSRQWDLRAQFTCYKWGCREAGVKVDGALIRGVSILKTKYDTQQAITYRPDWQVERWYTETMDILQQMIASWKSGYWRHSLDNACVDFGGCAFKQCCTSEDETPWLETYFERKRWNPIIREEIPL